MDEAACYTLKTRIARHYLKNADRYDEYADYLRNTISREELYAKIPKDLMDGVINLAIGPSNNEKIHKIIARLLKGRKVDLIIGGPPCQAYSLVGRARSSSGMHGDPRNYLYVEYARYLEKYSPSLFVFENVTGLKSAKGGVYLRNMENLFLKKGYSMKLFSVEANNFGVLQNRKRIIILGWKTGMNVNLPDLESIRSRGNFTVKEILSDLPVIPAGGGNDRYLRYRTKPTVYLSQTAIRNGLDILTQHIARPHKDQDKKIYKIAVRRWNSGKGRLDYNDLPEILKTHKNRLSFFDRFKVVADNLGYSQTVVAHIAKDGHYYIHPDINQNRSITVREAARLQSFPDDYYFEGVKEGKNRTAAFKQIGNAVPPLMSYEIAKELYKLR
jgi:DNA (cytosine-5)-methyltransferase 1